MEGQDREEAVSDIAGCNFVLRILANASAKVGNHGVESRVEMDTKVISALLDINLEYADNAMKMALRHATGQYGMVKWVGERDLLTRGLTCNLMRPGCPQGEALKIATREAEIKWATPSPRREAMP